MNDKIPPQKNEIISEEDYEVMMGNLTNLPLEKFGSLQGRIIRVGEMIVQTTNRILDFLQTGKWSVTAQAAEKLDKMTHNVNLESIDEQQESRIRDLCRLILNLDISQESKVNKINRKIGSSVDSPNFSKIDEMQPEAKLNAVSIAYEDIYFPKQNRNNLEKYHTSPEFQTHALTTKIYYNQEELLAKNDAMRVAQQREPTNINGFQKYNKNELKKLCGYEDGIYNDENAKKEDGKSFSSKPNSISIYSETYLWNSPGKGKPITIACLSLPAPALDRPWQPHFSYYVKNTLDKYKYPKVLFFEDKNKEQYVLDKEKYQKEIQFLFKCIERTIDDHKDSAFQGQGIKRVVLSKFGQAAFLQGLSEKQKAVAKSVYIEELKKFLSKMESKYSELEFVLSDFQESKDSGWIDKMVYGDIIKTAKERDLIINAWDPHSAPGNGNDNDPTFDGALGKSTGILLTQTRWFNKHMDDSKSYFPIS